MFKQGVFGKDIYDDKYYTNHFYIFKYDGDIRKLLLNYKFREKPYLYRSLIKFLKKYQKTYLQFDFYDIIIPVPISKNRIKTRGYNQSELIAKELSNTLNIKSENKVLIKIKNNLQQSLLDKDSRTQNVQNVYKVTNYDKIFDKKILLIDDIYTTGSTLNECAKMLKKAGSKKIDIFTIAKD